MGKIRVLDCTLRDGGYVNNWLFGEKYIRRIIEGLQNACIDIIECGYLADTCLISDGSTRAGSLKEFEKYILSEEGEDTSSYVCMLNFGEYSVDDLPMKSETLLDGIRVAFHKKDLEGALQLCRQIQDKGYDVYVQPMVTLSYSDEEILQMIREVNKICPKAFYIVDSYGSMRRKDLLRLFYLVSNNLSKRTMVGYHSHNNLQLAYSNAQTLVEVAGVRELIIDASIFGMGRGAGNLNTELFIEYLNNNAGGQYKVSPLLKVMDTVLSHIYMITPWGYSLPYYLSAVHNSHPNYASYFAKKNTLTVEDMNAIFSTFLEKKKNVFDEEYAETLYKNYLNRDMTEDENLEAVKKAIEGMDVLLIAPGKSLRQRKYQIQQFQKENNIITVAINSGFEDFETDYIFVSNLRRFKELDSENYKKAIVTSNIKTEKFFSRINYRKLENAEKEIRDNAGIMALTLMKMVGARKVYLAGFDGYSKDMYENYMEQSLYLKTDEPQISSMNEGMKRAIIHLRESMDVVFLTASRLDLGEQDERE